MASYTADMWSTPPTSQNNLYIFDAASLDVKGAVEGLAPGERIYAVRFTGQTAYMVTFRQVDPLFVIDLSQPDKPLVKGELKIPGFSNYLHPISSTQLIGVGYDAAEIEGRAVTTGVKLSLFDVADPSRPLELDSKVLGARGSSSLATSDHKAFLFHKASGLLVIPVHVRELSAKQKDQWTDDASRIPYGDEVSYPHFEEALCRPLGSLVFFFARLCVRVSVPVEQALLLCQRKTALAPLSQESQTRQIL